MGLRRGMEALLTGDAMSGIEAVESGYANRAFTRDTLDDEVLSIVSRIVKIPPDLLAMNKRAAHRAMEAMGIRDGIRATTELQALAFHQPSSLAYREGFGDGNLKEKLSERDETFGDYRES